MSRKIKIGVMGCASIADRMVIPAIKSSQNYELIAVASRTPEKGIAYGEKFGCEAIVGYENLLTRNDIEVIYIPLPTGLHFEWAIKALKHGKHILIEKSLASNLEEAQQIVHLAKEKNLLVKENFMFEYHRQFEMIKNILKERTLGTIRSIRSSFGFPPFKDENNIRYQAELGGGALLDAGAYTIKVASVLTDNKPTIVGASLTYDADKNVDTFGGIMMTYDDGCVIETAFGFDHFYQCNLEIWGNKGKLTADRIFTAGPGVSPRVTIETETGKEILEIEPDNHFLNLLDQFAQKVYEQKFEKEYTSILLQAQLLGEVKDKAKKNIV